MIVTKPKNYSKEALATPKVGDLWNERFSYHLVVVEITEEGKIYALEGRFSSFPEGGKSTIFSTLLEFQKFLSYSSNSSTWALCQHRGLDVNGWSELR